MARVEDLGDLDADAGKLVDVEEAAIVDVVGCDAEMRRPPELLLDQRVEPAPARKIAGSPVEAIRSFAIDGRRELASPSTSVASSAFSSAARRAVSLAPSEDARRRRPGARALDARSRGSVA